MLQLAEPTRDQTIPYDKAVAEGKAIVGQLESNCWRLADLANQIEPKYGNDTLGKFATEIGLKTGTVSNYRSMARAWPESTQRCGYRICRALLSLPNKEAVVRDNPHLTETQARELVNKYNARFSVAIDNDEDAINEQPKSSEAESNWRMSLSNMAEEAIFLPEYWKQEFGEWQNFNADSSMITLAQKAAAAWSDIAARMSIKKV